MNETRMWNFLAGVVSVCPVPTGIEAVTDPCFSRMPFPPLERIQRLPLQSGMEIWMSIQYMLFTSTDMDI